MSGLRLGAIALLGGLAWASPAAAQHSHSHSHRIHRSLEVKHDFERATGHPHGWPGHVIDHVVPLACGGADAPSNMAWQTIEEAKAKDRVERHGCAPQSR